MARATHQQNTTKHRSVCIIRGVYCAWDWPKNVNVYLHIALTGYIVYHSIHAMIAAGNNRGSINICGILLTVTLLNPEKYWCKVSMASRSCYSSLVCQSTAKYKIFTMRQGSDNKVHGANMGPTWVLSDPDGPHVGPMSLAPRRVHDHPIPTNKGLDHHYACGYHIALCQAINGNNAD